MEVPGRPPPRGGVPPPFRVLAHTADTAIEVRGGSREELIANAARGMFALMYGSDPSAPDATVSFAIGSSSEEDLLVDTLSELLFRSETDDLAFSRFTVERVGDCAVQVTAAGSPAAGLDLVGPPIKAVTYHGLQVVNADGWRARIIFDV